MSQEPVLLAFAREIGRLSEAIVGLRVESLDNRGQGTVKMVRFGSPYLDTELFVDWDRKLPGWIEVKDIRWLNEETR